MLVIRFLRTGKKNAPSFRLVLTEKTAPPKGKFLEILGFLNPRTKEWGLRGERVQYWISKGAQTSASAHNFLIKHEVIKGAKIPVHAESSQGGAVGSEPRAEGTEHSVGAEGAVSAKSAQKEGDAVAVASAQPATEQAPEEKPAPDFPKSEAIGGKSQSFRAEASKEPAEAPSAEAAPAAEKE